jgi:hypothetical protein
MRAFYPHPSLILVLTLAVGGSASLAAAERSPDQDTHALLRDRNIFDPTRRPDRPTENRRESEAPPRTETLSLIGTMLHAGRAFSFFDGSNPSFRQVLSPGETLAALKVGAITTAGAELEAEDGTVHWLPVGSRLHRVGEGAWSVADGSTRTSEAPGGAADSDSGAPATEGAAASGPTSETDDILRRMMERRRQEELR